MNPRRIHRSGVSLTVATVSFALIGSGCASGGSTSSAGAVTSASPMQKGKAYQLLPADVKTSKVLRVASSIGYAPYEFYASDNKTFMGIDIDILHAMEPILGVKLQIQDVRYPNIIPSLTAGRDDFAMSAYAEAPENEKKLDFVDYLRSYGGMVASAQDKSIKTNDPLSLCGKSIGTVSGETTSDPYIAETKKQCAAAGKPPLTAKQFQRTADALLAIQSGQLDVRTVGGPTGKYYAKNSPGLRFVPRVWPDEPPTVSGIAVPKGHEDLLKALQAALQQLVDNGTYKKILDKWNIADSALPKITLTQTQS